MKKKMNHTEEERQMVGGNRFQLMSIVKQFQMRKMVDWQPYKFFLRYDCCARIVCVLAFFISTQNINIFFYLMLLVN